VIIQKRVPVPMVDPETCQQQLQAVIGPEFVLFDTYFCGGGVAGESVCGVSI